MSNVAQIKIQLSNGQEAGKTINELTAQSAKFAREIKKMEVGSEDYVRATGDFKKVSDRLKEVKTEAFSTAKAQSFLNSEVGQFIPFNKKIGGMVGTFSGLAGAIKGATISQRALNIAIAASGIGLLVIIMAKLIQAFLDTQAGMDKVTAVTRPLMAIFERLKGLAQEMGGTIFKGLAQILKGDIAEGFKTLGSGVKEAVLGFGGAVKAGAAAGTAIDKLQKQIEITRNEMIVSQARLNRGIAEQSELARDASKTEAERQAAAQKAIDLIAERTAAEDRLLGMQIEKMEIEQSLNDTDRTGNAEMNQLIAQREDLIANAARERVRLNAVINRTEISSEKEITAGLKAETDSRTKALEDQKKAREEFKKESEKFVADSIASELKAAEESKKIDADMLAGYKASQQAKFDSKMNSLITMNEAEQMMIDELFLTNQLTQEERDLMLYDSQKKALEERLKLIADDGKASSEEYQKLYMELAALHYNHNESKIASDKKYADAKFQLEQQSLAVAAESFAAVIGWLERDEKAKKKNFAVIKAMRLAELTVSSIGEIQAIWKSAAENPLNAIFPGAAQVIAGVKTAAALVRYGTGVSKISQTKFAEGGVVKGPSHQAGGIKFSAAGQLNEMEGNEIILTKGVYQSPVLRSMASELNVMGGGRSFALGGPVLQDRGLMNTSSQSSAGIGAQPTGQSPIAGFGRMEEVLVMIESNTRVTAEKPVLAVTQIRDKLQMLQDTEQDAQF